GGDYPHLAAGDVLIFEEIRGPRTGRVEDADPEHRHAVRLTWVRHVANGTPLTDPLHDQPITEIAWAADDALPFPLCLSATTDEAHGRESHDDVSIVHGNIVLADHGFTIANEPLGAVTADRFQPRLTTTPLTQAAPFDATLAAARAMRWPLRD